MKKVILVAVLLVLGSEVVAAVSSGQIACFKKCKNGGKSQAFCKNKCFISSS